MFLFESDLNCFDANCGMTSQLLVKSHVSMFTQSEQRGVHTLIHLHVSMFTHSETEGVHTPLLSYSTVKHSHYQSKNSIHTLYRCERACPGLSKIQFHTQDKHSVLHKACCFILKNNCKNRTEKDHAYQSCLPLPGKVLGNRDI